MKKPILKIPPPNSLADKCPACGRHSLHKVQRYCLSFGCGFAEDAPAPRRKIANRKS